MSDVRPYSSHLKLSPETNPYFQAVRDCIELLNQGGSLKHLKGKKIEVEHLVDETDFFIEQYDKIRHAYDDDKLVSFKKELKRTINCGVRGTFMGIPGQFHVACIMCKGRGCLNCSPYKARERCRYTDTIAKIVMVDNHTASKDFCNEVKLFIEAQGFNWLVVVDTPFADGTSMVRISNLRQHDMNPLVGNNEVKESMVTIEEMYPVFESVTRISDDESIESVYVTSTNSVQFTSTEIYSARYEGRGQPRESGTKKGYEYNFELNEIVHMTDIQRKKKEEDELGIIDTLNIAAANIEGVTDEHLEQAVADGVDEIIENDIGVMKADTLGDIKHLGTTFMDTFRISLMSSGYDQPEIYHNIKITQESIDKFYREYGIPTTTLPDNFMSIEYTEESQGIGVETHGLRQRVDAINNRSLAKTQDKMKKAMTRQELIHKFVEDIKKLH